MFSKLRFYFKEAPKKKSGRISSIISRFPQQKDVHAIQAFSIKIFPFLFRIPILFIVKVFNHAQFYISSQELFFVAIFETNNLCDILVQSLTHYVVIIQCVTYVKGRSKEPTIWIQLAGFIQFIQESRCWNNYPCEKKS